ncbi:hypothetical protein V8F33_002990 [Rhypophila sp. PSN 637]
MARVKHRNGLNHQSLSWILRTISESKAESVYNASRRTSALTADEIAKRLTAAGITPQTIFIVWHYASTDLRLIRNFLEEENYTGILPEDRNCISLLKPFDRNLNSGPAGPQGLPTQTRDTFSHLLPTSWINRAKPPSVRGQSTNKTLGLSF